MYQDRGNVGTHFLISETGLSFGIHSWFYRNRVISFHQNERGPLARFLLTECSELADLSHQHAATCFYPITFPAHPRPLESATRDGPAVGGGPGPSEMRRKRKFHRGRENDVAVARGVKEATPKSRAPSLNNRRRTGLVVL